MIATLPIPTRTLAAIGLALLAALALMLVVRPLLSGDDASTATPATQATGAPTTNSRTTSAKPAVTLLPGIPKPLVTKLRKEPVVVVSIYSGTSGTDRALVTQARKGAKATGAAYATFNVLEETSARDVSSFFGTVDVPAVAVVRRPGTVVTLLEGNVDAAIVEQAAHNAGARR